ncbi:MAG: TetR family transcriptional regulator [Acetobacteraceae bacterium]|nr:TetR family transcriptional regulator [Acetobacteraceae bacterium]
MTVLRRSTHRAPSRQLEAAGSITRARILAAATEVFVRRGIEAGTIREITKAAGVNVAAVNYHFGSREALLRATLAEVAGPMNAARLQALDQEARAHAPHAPPLPAIVDALVRPLIETPRWQDGTRPLIRLIQQLRALPHQMANQLMAEQFDAVAHRFIAALHAALPHLSRAEIVWRYEFARGAVVHVLVDCDPESGRLAALSGGACRTGDQDELLCQATRFVAAGFSAPGR